MARRKSDIACIIWFALRQRRAIFYTCRTIKASSKAPMAGGVGLTLGTPCPRGSGFRLACIPAIPSASGRCRSMGTARGGFLPTRKLRSGHRAMAARHGKISALGCRKAIATSRCFAKRWQRMRRPPSILAQIPVQSLPAMTLARTGWRSRSISRLFCL